MKSNLEKNMEKSVQHYVYKAFKILLFILLGLAIAFLVGYIVMRLWNWLMPDIFGLPQIDYWKAVGILLFSKIIFGFGGGDGPGNKKKNKRKKFPKFDPCKPLRNDFSKWKHYDEFWKNEGEEAYKDYVARNESINNG
ncbi:hypothetical protein DFQ03_0556 [Maribacter caenipelagi]|uniref:Uncharacterized protein n=1 Tax=Maribacter caenipelagi TaxID=1447781 RepID=A0A4R7DHT5_9FLAO|nr:hypothetical protein [Maribacter caenipelagi]TDS18846.1 hypothetical protein DFQ03_0556 [Maribacter caenipelagi]